MSEKLLPFLPKVAVTEPAIADPLARLEATVSQLVAAVEEFDRGMKLFVGVVSDHDKRLRALELAQRKADRKNVPVIVNQHGERAN